jgi:putative transcriptional regulator
MRPHENEEPSLAGSLLIAHPGLLDPNFRQTIILLSAHGPKDGAFGVVINRPLGKDFSFFNSEASAGPLAHVPIYYGGPVQPTEIILAAWRWDADAKGLRLIFGMPPHHAERLLQEDPGIDLRGFLGYSGWGGGQLESELSAQAWLVTPILDGMLRRGEDTKLWREVLISLKPELIVLADSPDDPSVN